MRRLARLGVSAAFAATLLLALGAEIADTMIITIKGETQPQVTFQHRPHAMERAIPCTRCHHNMAEEGTPGCDTCHTLAGEAQVRNLEDAYHDSCLLCHSTPPKGTSPPVECEDCHKPGNGQTPPA